MGCLKSCHKDLASKAHGRPRQAIAAPLMNTSPRGLRCTAATSGTMPGPGAVPPSLADACLIRMPELQEPCRVVTLDSGFHVYRRHGRTVIPLLRPE